jgi:hypothetical protein
MFNEWQSEMMWNDAVMAYFKAVSQYAAGGPEETTKLSVTVAGVRNEIRNLHF